jgi:hypothetical protein
VKQPPDSGGFDIVRFVVEHGPWALLGAALGGFVGLAVGGPGAPPPRVDGALPATEWSDYVAHSWLAMLIGALLGAVVLATVAKFVKDKLRTR